MTSVVRPGFLLHFSALAVLATLAVLAVLPILATFACTFVPVGLAVRLPWLVSMNGRVGLRLLKGVHSLLVRGVVRAFNA